MSPVACLVSLATFLTAFSATSSALSEAFLTSDLIAVSEPSVTPPTARLRALPAAGIPTVAPVPSAIFAAADLMTIKSAYTAFDDDKEISDVESEYKRILTINLSDAIDVLKKEADSLKAKYDELKNALEDKGIYVSAGSACSTNKPHKSHTLVAIGLPNKLIESTLRFSFCEKNTKEEIDYAVGVIEEILPMLRKYKRG